MIRLFLKLIYLIFLTTGSELVDIRLKYNYIFEDHKVKSHDDYNAKLIRISLNPNNNIRSLGENANCTILITHEHSDLDNLVQNRESLAYRLAFTGCDIWLGPSRNTAIEYSLQSIFTWKFWQFDFYKNEVNDLKAITDYILIKTKQKSLHYIGYSNTYSVLTILSLLFPEYKEIYKTIQMIDPMVEHDDLIVSFEKLMSPFEAQPNIFTTLMNCNTLRRAKPFLSKICSVSFIRPICAGVLNLDYDYNQTESNHTKDFLKQTTDYEHIQEYYVGNIIQYSKDKVSTGIVAQKLNVPVVIYHQSDISFSAVNRNIDQLHLILTNIENKERDPFKKQNFQNIGINNNEVVFNKMFKTITNNR